MKTFSLALTLLTSLSSFAQAQYQSLDSYYAVATQEERSKNTNWMPVLDGRIELVKEFKTSQKVENLNFPESINLEKLKTLQVRDLYIDQSSVTANNDQISIPFVISLRYEENVLVQGTLNASGMISINLEEPSTPIIDLVYFSDSQWVEELGRTLGIIDAYEARFLETVVNASVLNQFKDEELINKILTISELYQDINNVQLFF